MGFLDSIFGGGGTSTTTNTTTPTLSAEDQANKDLIAQQAKEAYARSIATQNQQGYTGPAPVGPSDTTRQAQQTLTGAAGVQTALGQSAAGATNFGLYDALNVADNRYVQDAKNASNTAQIQQFTQAGGPLSQVRSGSVANGGYGGSRQGIAEALSMNGLSQAIANSNAQYDLGAYNTGVGAYNNTLNSMPAISAMQTQGGATLAGVGANQEGYQQQQNNYEAAMRDWNVNKDWQQLNNLASLLYPGINTGSNSTSTKSGSSGNMQDIGTLMQLISTGMGMYAAA